MQLLDDPRTWIVAAAVLVVLAIVLIVSASWRRRSRARAAATAAPREVVPTPVASPPPAPAPATDDWADEDDAVTGPLALPSPATAAAPTSATPTEAASSTAAAPDAAPTAATPTEAAPSTAATPSPAAQDAPTSSVTSPSASVAEPEPAVRPSVSEPGSVAPAEGMPAGRGVPPPSEHATDQAKDRLLALLLSDPETAVRTVAGLRNGASAGDSGSSVTSLLRAGLSPTQVADLTGIPEADLADAVARDLGLLVRPQPADVDRTGRNATDAPGRSWANVGSAAGSTTPTTG